MIQRLLQYIRENDLIKKSLVTVFIRGFGTLLLFGLTLYMTNNFDASKVGEYDTAKSILEIFGSLCLLGLNEAVVYYSGFFRAKNALGSLRKLYRKMLLIILSAFAGIMLIYFLGLRSLISLFYEDEGTANLIMKTFFILGFHALTMLNIDMYRALNKINIYAIFRDIYRHIFFFGGLIMLVFLGQHQYLVDVFLANYVFLGILSTLFVLRALNKIEQSGEVIDLSNREVLTRSLPMTISAAAYLLLQNTDILVLKKFAPYSEVAYYGRAVQLAKLVSLVLYAVVAAYATRVAELFALKQFEQLKSEIRQSTRLIFVLTLPAVALLLLFSDFFLGLFGTDYKMASTALSILLIGQILNATTGTIGMYMNMTGEHNRLQTVFVTAVIFNLILDILLIPLYGMKGAAIATATTTIAWNLYCVIYLYRKRGIKTFLH